MVGMKFVSHAICGTTVKAPYKQPIRMMDLPTALNY